MNKLLIVLMLSLSVNAANAEWIPLAKDSQNNFHLVKYGSVLPIRDKTIRMWKLLNIAVPWSIPSIKDTKSVVSLVEVDCQYNSQQTLQTYGYTEYNGQGDITIASKIEPVAFLPPDSAEYRVNENVCKAQFPS